MKVETTFSVCVYPGESDVEQEMTQPAFHKRVICDAVNFNEAVLREQFEDFIAAQKVGFLG